MANFGLLTAEICWRVWSTPAKFQRVLHLGSVTARHSSSGRYGVEQRAPPVFGRAAITLSIDPHSSCICMPKVPVKIIEQSYKTAVFAKVFKDTQHVYL